MLCSLLYPANISKQGTETYCALDLTRSTSLSCVLFQLFSAEDSLLVHPSRASSNQPQEVPAISSKSYSTLGKSYVRFI